MDSASAAPLMCAGSTVFSALRENNVKCTDRVGVVGLGGLGHLALQFAAKMGCEVVAFSSTESKREEAIAFGAKEFYVVGKNLVDAVKKPIDHLLVAASAQPDWDSFMPVLGGGATIHLLTVSLGEPVGVPALPFVMHGMAVQGSFIASRKVHREMLEFAAFHDINPTIELFPMTEEGIERAFEKLKAGKIRYRAVCVTNF